MDWDAGAEPDQGHCSGGAFVCVSQLLPAFVGTCDKASIITTLAAGSAPDTWASAAVGTAVMADSWGEYALMDRPG